MFVRGRRTSSSRLGSAVFGLAVLGLSSISSAETCYYPDGSIATNYAYVSCGGDTKACCIPSEKDKCLSNGLCYWPAGNYPFRGACSDKDWGDKCPSLCVGARRDTWNKLNFCGGSKYCCSDGLSTDCCKDDAKLLDLDGVQVINDFATWTSTQFPTATSTIQFPTATSKSQSSMRPRDTETATVTVTGTSIHSDTRAPQPSAGGDSASGAADNSKTYIGVGAGVGSAVLACVLGLVAWLLYKKRKASGVKKPGDAMTGQQVQVGGSGQKSDGQFAAHGHPDGGLINSSYMPSPTSVSSPAPPYGQWTPVMQQDQHLPQQYPQQAGAFCQQPGYQATASGGGAAPAPAGWPSQGEQAPSELHGHSRQNQVYEAP